MTGAARLRRGLSLRKGGGSSCASSIHPRHSSSSHGQQRRSFSGCSDVVSARKLGANMWESLDFGPPEVREDVQHRRKEEMDLMSGHFCEHGGCDEVTAHHPSMALHRRRKEHECTLKTSTEIMKILSRIWDLEEQQESDISLIEELRSELNHARARIKDLVQDQVADRQVIGELLNKIPEEESVRKIKEDEMIEVAVKEVERELEIERKSRRRLEGLHQKLVEEISELKSFYSKSMRDLERERKIRKLLDDLCKEFAEGVLCWEEKMQELRCKVGGDCVVPGSHQLMLHISETWLDKRLELKMAEDDGDAEKLDAVLARLRRDVGVRRGPQETIPLHGIVGVPQDGEGEGSTSSIPCFELSLSDDGVINSNLGSVGNQRETVDGVRRSSSVRDKIGYFESVVCHREK